MRRVRAWWAAVGLLVGSVGDARAEQPTLAGSWSAGPLIENVTVTSWVDECGPKPKSSSSAGGGFKIAVSGDELVFSGGKSFRTDQCWDMGLARRVSHSATPAIRWWKTRCESPPGDPRTAQITTVVRAVDDDTIVLSESAKYSSTLASGSCAATVERSRTFKIVARDGATATPTATATTTPTATATTTPAPTATAKPAPTVDCSSPGDLATVDIKPRKKRVRPGEQFDFRARLLDAKGCELAGKATFRLDSSSVTAVSVDGAGHVKVGADAEPQVVAIVVDAAGKSAKVEVEVMSDQAYADLIASGGGDAGADESSVAIVVTSGGGETKVVDPGKPEEGRRRFAYLAIAGGFCTLLALGAVIFWRRGNAKVAAEKARRDAERDAAKARRDAEKAARSAPPAVAGSKTCPTCRTVLPPHAQFCPNDGTVLGGPPGAAPAPAFQPPPAFQAPTAVRPRGRICPVCGARYEAEAGFCSKDGSSLVPLN